MKKEHSTATSFRTLFHASRSEFKYPKHLSRWASLNLKKLRAKRVFEKVVCSFAIIALKPTPSILLVARAKDESFAGRLECPGGALEDDDPSFLHGAVREVEEETQISIKDVKDMVVCHAFKHTNKHTKGKEAYIKVTFLAVYDERPQVKLNEEEHSNFGWYDVKTIESLRSLITDDIQYHAIELAILCMSKGEGFSEMLLFDTEPWYHRLWRASSRRGEGRAIVEKKAGSR